MEATSFLWQSMTITGVGEQRNEGGFSVKEWQNELGERKPKLDDRSSYRYTTFIGKLNHICLTDKYIY